MRRGGGVGVGRGGLGPAGTGGRVRAGHGGSGRPGVGPRGSGLLPRLRGRPRQPGHPVALPPGRAVGRHGGVAPPLDVDAGRLGPAGVAVGAAAAAGPGRRDPGRAGGGGGRVPRAPGDGVPPVRHPRHPGHRRRRADADPAPPGDALPPAPALRRLRRAGRAGGDGGRRPAARGRRGTGWPSPAGTWWPASSCWPSGMAAGAHWAYVELGWGGYWAWDPVENGALLPWLAGIAFLHSALVARPPEADAPRPPHRPMAPPPRVRTTVHGADVSRGDQLRQRTRRRRLLPSRRRCATPVRGGAGVAWRPTFAPKT